jgi:hypothetical protein
MGENYEDEYHEIPKELTQQTPIFVAEFMEGYSFRGIIDYLKLTNVNGPFIFHKDAINYSQCDATETILNNLEIRTFDLTHYQFNHSTPVAYGVTLANLKQNMAVVGKKDGVRFISYLTQPFIFIQHLGQGSDESGRKNISMVRVQSSEPVQMTVEGYKRGENDPNCTVRVQDFCKTCSNVVRVKSDYVTIKSCPTGIRFQAMLDGSISGSYYEFGNFNKAPLIDNNKNEQLKRLTDYLSSITFDNVSDVSDSSPKLVVKDSDELNTIRVKSSYIKALSKLNNSFKEGTVKMYMEEGLPLKLIFNNTYARLTIYLQNKK